MWDQIKKVLQKRPGTCIIIEDGRPVYVILNFDEYEKIIESQQTEKPTLSPHSTSQESLPSPEQELLEKINQDITEWKTKQEEKEIDESEVIEKKENEIEIEDLPL